MIKGSIHNPTSRGCIHPFSKVMTTLRLGLKWFGIFPLEFSLDFGGGIFSFHLWAG
jgi:hypothetical protein